MKLAFPSLGFTEDNIFALAKESGYDAVEIVIEDQKLLNPQFIQSFAEKSLETNIGISCLSSNICLLDKENEKININSIIEYIDSAANSSIPYIQVICDPHTDPRTDIDLDFLVDNLSFLANYAAKKNVMLLIETNGVFSDSHLLTDLLKIISNPNLGVLWNVHHPYRFCLESIDETYETLKKYIKYIHLSDSLLSDNGPEYCQIGEGDIPINQALLLLKNHHFAGYISLSLINEGNKNLINPEINLRHFINYVQKI